MVFLLCRLFLGLGEEKEEVLITDGCSLDTATQTLKACRLLCARQLSQQGFLPSQRQTAFKA